MRYIFLILLVVVTGWPSPVQAKGTSGTVAAGAAVNAGVVARNQRRRNQENSAKVVSCDDPDKTYVVICNAKLTRGMEVEVPGINDVASNYHGCNGTSISQFFMKSGVPKGSYKLSSFFDTYNKNWVITGCLED